MTLQELMAAANDPEKCEGTSNPWWFVFDPRGMAGRCMTYHDAITTACMSIHGPFFSRESATRYRESQRHNLSEHAVVWCGSAHMSFDFRALTEMAKATDPQFQVVGRSAECCDPSHAEGWPKILTIQDPERSWDMNYTPIHER